MAVAFEVIFALQHLINRYGLKLVDSSWSIILSIILQVMIIANTGMYRVRCVNLAVTKLSH